MQNQKRILIVDDNRSNRLIFSEYLRMNSYHVIEAADGEIAMRQLHDNKFDVVLLDLMLPKVDGIELLKNIKSNESYSQTKVFLFTVLGRDKIIQEAFELGADGFFIKDKITPEYVKQKIDTELKASLNKL